MRKRTLLCVACCAASIAFTCVTAVLSPVPVYAEAAIGDTGQAESDDIELYGGASGHYSVLEEGVWKSATWDRVMDSVLSSIKINEPGNLYISVQVTGNPSGIEAELFQVECLGKWDITERSQTFGPLAVSAGDYTFDIIGRFDPFVAGSCGLKVKYYLDVPGKYTDVDSDTAHAEDVTWLGKSGVSDGWSESDGTRTFRPYTDIARADMAAFLYRLAGKPEYTAPATSPFKDVTSDTPHYEEICWLAEKGISQGWSVSGGREFRPYASVARCDMAAFLYRMAGSPSYTVSGSPFIDCSSKTPHYKEVCWLASTGVSAGWDVSGGREFRSYTKVARADMAAFLHRMKDKGLV